MKSITCDNGKEFVNSVVSKGTRFSDISQQHVDQVVKEINSKPLTHAHKQQKSPQYLFKRATRHLRQQRAQRDEQLLLAN